jgi:hypothetical protein
MDWSGRLVRCVAGHIIAPVTRGGTLAMSTTRGTAMNTTTIIIILVVLLVLGGGWGFSRRGRL